MRYVGIVLLLLSVASLAGCASARGVSMPQGEVVTGYYALPRAFPQAVPADGWQEFFGSMGISWPADSSIGVDVDQRDAVMANTVENHDRFAKILAEFEEKTGK